MKKKNLAFTLAEVLIVIGIIGVVAALTLPNLNHATGDKEKVTKVKKIYSALTEAVDRAQAIYGPFDTWFKDLRDSNGYITNEATANERFAKRVTEFVKVSKDCGTGSGCFSSAPLLEFDGQQYNDNENYLSSLQPSYMVALSDGISLAFSSGDNGRIRVDIDGPNKGKNQIGKDIFDFTIFYNANFVSIPDNLINQLIPSYFNQSGNVYSYETAWVIENGNLDYLNADWDGKCNDSDIILNWTTNTSCH